MLRNIIDGEINKNIKLSLTMPKGNFLDLNVNVIHYTCNPSRFQHLKQRQYCSKKKNKSQIIIFYVK